MSAQYEVINQDIKLLATFSSITRRVVNKRVALPAARRIGAGSCVNTAVIQVGSESANYNRATQSTPDTVTGTT